MSRVTGLSLNLIPITFTAETFRGSELEYEGREQLYELREKHRSTHLIKRDGSKIQCVPLRDGASELGREANFDVREHFVLAERLVQRSLVQLFKERDEILTRLSDPTTIVLHKQNLMTKVTDDDHISSLLPLYPEYQLQARLIVPHDMKIVFGILLNFKVFHHIEGTVEQLMEANIDPINCYVADQSSDPYEQAKPLSFQRKPLAGKVVNVGDGRMLHLTDYRDSTEIDSGHCWLEPSPSNIQYCMRALCGDDLQEIQQGRMRQIFEVTGARQQHDRLVHIAAWLRKRQPIQCCNELHFKVDSHAYKPILGNEAGQYCKLTEPTYMLRPGGHLPFNGRVDNGIDENGPYDAESFPNKRVTIGLVYPERFKGEVEVFMRQFQEGVPRRPRKVIPFTQGFIRKYRLTNCEIKEFSVPRGREDAGGYRETSIEALRGHGIDIAVVVIKDAFHQLQGEENPYYVAKSIFMSQGVPVQSVKIEKIRNEYSRPWILNNIALAMYAKLGGIPYVLTSTPGLAHELVFGIGSSNIKTRRLDQSERYIGITTVFSGDGNYLLYNLTKEVVFEDYETALLQSLDESLEEVRARYNWQPGDKLRLVFHQSYKQFKKLEAQAVKKFVGTITDLEVEYAFVHVSRRSHPWKVFDKGSSGVDSWLDYKKYKKGGHVPQRGLYIPLGPQAALLTLTGPRQLKTHLQGCPEPILISVHRESTFNSQEYICNQIYKLTFMSWKSFSPSTVPVTIDYSDMIANLMGHLRAIPNWNPDVLRTSLRESRWFL